MEKVIHDLFPLGKPPVFSSATHSRPPRAVGPELHPQPADVRDSFCDSRPRAVEMQERIRWSMFSLEQPAGLPPWGGAVLLAASLTPTSHAPHARRRSHPHARRRALRCAGVRCDHASAPTVADRIAVISGLRSMFLRSGSIHIINRMQLSASPCLTPLLILKPLTFLPFIRILVWRSE